jgi:hypothetical protein
MKLIELIPQLSFKEREWRFKATCANERSARDSSFSLANNLRTQIVKTRGTQL